MPAGHWLWGTGKPPTFGESFPDNFALVALKATS